MNQNKKQGILKLLGKGGKYGFIKAVGVSSVTMISIAYLIYCYIIFEIKEPTITIKGVGITVVVFGFILTFIGLYSVKTLQNIEKLSEDSIELGDLHVDETIKFKEETMSKLDKIDKKV